MNAVQGRAASAVTADGGRQAAAEPALSLFVPVYTPPAGAAGMWSVVTGSAPAVSSLIANVSSGPGNAADPAFTAAISAAQAAGITVWGYVHTSYTARPLADVQADVNRWSSFYGITNIFFDEATTDAGAPEVSYYTTATGYASGRKALNPGTVPAQAYAPLADVICVFEGSWDSWQAGGYAPPAWFTGYPPGKFYVIVFGVPSWPAAAAVLDTIRGTGAWNAYLTDVPGAFANIYTALPPWWAQECTRAVA
jgi:hypothetical protein